MSDWDKQAQQAELALKDAKTSKEKATAFYWLAVAANRKNQHKQAEEYALQAISLEPTYAEAYSILSSAQRRQGKLEEALESAKKCEKYAPSYGWCHYALGAVYSETGDWEQSLDHVKRAFHLSPQNTTIAADLEYTKKMIAMMEKNNAIESATPAPGCSDVTVVNEMDEICTAKRKTLSFIYSSNTPKCLDVINDNCHGPAVRLHNTCPQDTIVYFENQLVPAESHRIFHLTRTLNGVSYFGTGFAGDTNFYASYTPSESYCE